MIPRPARRMFAVMFAVVLLAAGCASARSGSQPLSVAFSFTDSPDAGGPAITATASSANADAGDTDASPWPMDPTEPEDPLSWRIEILGATPHDPDSYTQGLELADGVLYESGGLYGESSIRRVDPTSGKILSKVDLDPSFFGEGLTVIGDQLVQITWREGTALRWDRQTLEPLGQWEYQGEGWGLCLAGDRLVMSDGTSRLTWRDPNDFSVISTIEVRLAGAPVNLINELECVGDLVIANIYTTTTLVVIDPQTGDVLATIDASALMDLVPHEITDVNGNVLNGIANMGDGTLLLAGKLWPETFTVRIVSS